LLLKRYSNIEYIIHLPLKRGIKLLKKAMEEDTKEYAYRIYLAAYPNMDKKNFKTFNEFWEETKPQNVIIDTRSEDEIMEEILEIDKKFKKGGN
jgi:wyosine [tRNA(Phe)-imidazoG37] synthetase (radical SAM superfamily)